MIDSEEFDAWRQSPVTQWFLRALEIYAKDAESQVMANVWGAGMIDPLSIERARGQAFSAVYFASASYGDIAKYHEEKQ